MVRTREELTKIFSEKVIDHEIERVKQADDGDILFQMDSWENPDFVDSILSYADVKYATEFDDGIVSYIKG